MTDPTQAQDAAPVVQDQAVKDAIVALFGIGGLVKKIVADKTISLSDIPALAALEPSLALVAGELPAVKAQLAAMSEAEAEDLALYIGSQVTSAVDSASVVAQVQAAIAFVEAGYALVKSF
jgi:hypothetical protein